MCRENGPFSGREECPGKTDIKGVATRLGGREQCEVYRDMDGGGDGAELVPAEVLTLGISPSRALAPWGKCRGGAAFTHQTCSPS